jgi:hypothetical protein
MEAMAQSGNPSGAFSVVLPMLGILLFLAALVAMICAISFLFPGPVWIPLWNLNPAGYETFHHLGWRAVAFLLAMATISGTTATGLWMCRRWAWWSAMMLFAANAIGDLVSFMSTSDVLRFGAGIAVTAGFVVLLMLPLVRRSLR